MGYRFCFAFAQASKVEVNPKSSLSSWSSSNAPKESPAVVLKGCSLLKDKFSIWDLMSGYKKTKCSHPWCYGVRVPPLGLLSDQQGWLRTSYRDGPGSSVDLGWLIESINGSNMKSMASASTLSTWSLTLTESYVRHLSSRITISMVTVD